MKFSHSAFTMIELIFVIVILGILAVVAIPKLSATRDDARIVKLAQMIMIGSQEIATYAVSSGETNDSFSNMSNNFEMLEKSGAATLSTKKAVIKSGSVNDCITVEVNTTNTSEILQITEKPNGGGDYLCSDLQALIDSTTYPIHLRGQLVKP